MKKIQNSIHPDDDVHYEKMGLKKGEVQEWEDGNTVETVSAPAVGELMYFGKSGADKKFRSDVKNEF